MCGIAGIVGSDYQPAAVQAMVRVQHHRGPDGSGTYHDPLGRCGLGHNRLSIIDLSDAGHQPMADASGRRWLTFNGEIYNYRELRAQLAHYPFTSHTDSEVILAAYAEWGEACVERFIGMFAFAIWDEADGTLFCARDRLGIKPFCYYQRGATFYFASEIKGLIAAGYEPVADRGVWADYLFDGVYDHGQGTFFAGVTNLEPGHTLSWKDGRVTSRRYWDARANSAGDVVTSRDAAIDQLDRLTADAVNLRLRSDVPLGVNLSGGLDSTLLFSYVDQSSLAQQTLNCFTAGFDHPAYDEAQFANSVPRSKDWQVHIERLAPRQAWDLIDPLMHHEEAPFGGIATLAYFNLHRRVVDEGVTVVLEGQGIDEMFAGYAYYRSPARPGIYQDGTSFLRPDLLRADAFEMASARHAGQPSDTTTLADRLYQDLRHTKLPRVLRMNDRLSMAHSRELRVPFLDHRIVELSFRIADELKISGDTGKWIIRELVARRVGPEAAYAAKRAVVTPQREWLRGPLREPIFDMLHSERFKSSPFFDWQRCVAAFENYCDGEGDNAFFVWQWINHDSWDRTFGAAH